jgi:adenylate cyclase class 2
MPFRYPDGLPLETEIKLKVANLDAIRRRLRYLRYRVHARRIFESNVVFDTTDRQFQSHGELLRVRRAGRNATLTYKGPGKPGRHKSREELETSISDADVVEHVLTRLGCQKTFRYEKFRTEYARPDEPGILTIDETPIGNYVELEGAPDWIDDAARELGFSPSDYVTKSYGTLYLEYCRERGVAPANMLFSRRTGERLTGRSKSS